MGVLMHLVYMQTKKNYSGVQIKLRGMFLCLLFRQLELTVFLCHIF